MKIEELRLLIKDVVRETMREELSSILTEAVKIASTPTVTEQHTQKPTFSTPNWVQELGKQSQQVIPEQRQYSAPSDGVSLRKDPMSLLAETARTMTSVDMQNFG